MSRHHGPKHHSAAWQAVRRRVLERDDYSCVLCHRRTRLECDHIVPLADGGSDDMCNLRTLCRWCHMKQTGADNKVHQVRGQDEWGEFVEPRKQRAR